MARSLLSKAAKVALSSLLFSLSVTSYAQTLVSKTSVSQTITYSCRATRLETVMTDIARQSGYDLIYSKSIIDVSRRVSLTVRNKSITEVLALIEPQADVSFRLHDRYIVIRSNPKPAAVEIPERTKKQIAVAQPALDADDSPLLTSTSKAIPVRIFESQAKLLENNLNKRIIELQRLLGANMPHNIPNQYVNRINFYNRYNGWYTSLGTYVTDNASGLEFQAGLKYIYTVFTPRWSADHGFYAGYGIGSSLQLRGRLSLNTMYLFSGYKDSEVLHHYRMGVPDGFDTRHTVTMRQHQVKLGLRYSFNENLSLRAGPVLNYRSTLKQVSIIPPGDIPPGSVEYRTGYGAPTAISNTQFFTKSSHLTERWVGWDISLQYRINFYKKVY